MIFQSKVCIKTWKKPQSMYIPTTIILAEKRSTFYKNWNAQKMFIIELVLLLLSLTKFVKLLISNLILFCFNKIEIKFLMKQVVLPSSWTS